MKAIPLVNDSRKLLPWLFVTGLAVALCLATSSLYCPVCKAGNAPPHASADRSGELPAGSARTFTLMADMGSVHILPQPAGAAPAAKIETQGGHITVLDIDGDLDAYTAGGFIQARDVAGNAKIRTGGGHIRASHIRGTAQLETDGGNITVGEAGALVGVRTGGGQIDFGEVHGSVHAETGGGGVRVMYVSGPMDVETSGGGICLTRVSNVVRAATGNGTITAWITPESGDASRPVRLPGPSQLSSGSGDIVVFLPRNLAATIEASVENGGADRIEADSALGVNMETHEDGPVRASGALNGGGAVLKLRSNAGKIRLRDVDEQTALRQALLDEQRDRLVQKINQMGV